MNLNIKQKLLAGFAVMLATLLGVGGVAYYQVSALARTISVTQGKEAFLGRAQSALWELRYGFPQFLVLTDEESRNKIVAAEPGLYQRLEENLKAFGEAPGLTREEAEGHKAATAAWDAYKVRRATWFTLIAGGKTEEAAAWRAQYTTPLGAATVRAFGQLIDLTSKSDAERSLAQVQQADQTKTLLLVLAAVSAALGVAAAVLTLRSMVTPMARLQTVLQRLRGGDYAARAHLANKDELGDLGRALDNLLDERLENLNRQAKESEQISNSVVEIMQAVGQVAANKDLSIRVPVTEDVTGAIGDAMNLLTTETAKVLGVVTDVSNDVSAASLQVKQSSDSAMTAASQSQVEVESAARELSQAAQTLTELARMAQQANTSAEAAVRTTREALGIVDRTVSGINESRDLIRETEKRIKRLGERSQEISQVVGLINSIAERTGILALNASMQATAAGEAGRGFAIVADEVKRLSESAREATREIATLVASIQSETSETVLAMNTAIAQVVDVSKLADQAGAQMKGTQLATDELAANVRHIAATSLEQARAGQTLQTRAQLMQQSSRDAARQLSAQGEMTSRLVVYAQSLVREVAVFKLPRRRTAE
jgi:methyl-accepting chemotaxis protein